jgi:hypothetical protein
MCKGRLGSKTAALARPEAAPALQKSGPSQSRQRGPPAWLGSGRGFWQRGRVVVVVVCGRGEGVVVVVVVVVIWSILE